MTIVQSIAMKILLISNDPQLIKMLQQHEVTEENELFILKETSDPLDVHSSVHRIYPSLLIIDDDFLKPNSARIIRSIKDINKNFKIIFVTSNEGLELGKEISQIGIHYYALKPVDEDELVQSFKSVIKLNQSNVHY